MADRMIWYTTVDRYGNHQHEEAVMLSRIVRLSKDIDNFDITVIHLDTGERLHCGESIKTMQARINAANNDKESE